MHPLNREQRRRSRNIDGTADVFASFTLISHVYSALLGNTDNLSLCFSLLFTQFLSLPSLSVLFIYPLSLGLIHIYTQTNTNYAPCLTYWLSGLQLKDNLIWRVQLRAVHTATQLIKCAQNRARRAACVCRSMWVCLCIFAMIGNETAKGWPRGCGSSIGL